MLGMLRIDHPFVLLVRSERDGTEASNPLEEANGPEGVT